MKKILICGASGFVGRYLLDAFTETAGYEVRATWNKNANLTDVYHNDVEWVHANLTNSDDVKKVFSGVDIVLQYAAISTSMKDAVEKPYIHVTDNVVMNSLMMREAHEQGVEHFIFPSCTVMYEPLERPVKEKDFKGYIDNDNIYFGGGSTKVYLEQMCEFYSQLGNTKYTAIRQSNIYGKYDTFDSEEGHFFPATIDKVLKSEDSISVWGDGTEKKDLLYVEDLIELIKLIIGRQTNEFQLVNAGYGKSFTITDIVKSIIKGFGKDLKIKYDTTKPSRKVGLELDISKSEKVFGWKPKYNLESGIEKLTHHERLK